MGTLKKIYLYQHTPKEIVVDSFVAKEWDDFLVIKVKSNDPEIVVRMQPMLERLNKEMNKQVIIVHEDVDIDFYGVEEAEDDSRPGNN